MLKKNIIFLILIIGIAIKFLGINNVLYADEADWAMGALQFNSMENYGVFIEKNLPHPPIPILSYTLMINIFGNQTYSFRLVPVIYSLFGLIFIYLISKEIYSRRAAFFALFLSLFAFWPYLASLQVDIDGAILTTFLLGTFYYYLRYEKTNKNKYLFLTGLFLGLGMLSKISGILGFIILGLYILFRNKALYKSIRNAFIPFIIGGGIFCLFLVLLYLMSPKIFLRVFMHGIGSAELSFFKISFIDIIYSLLWGTPLFAGLMIINLIKYSKKDMLFYIWFIVPVIFYFFAGKPLIAPFDRYLMVIIPAMAIIGGKYMAALALSRKNKILLISSFLVSFILFEILNSYTRYETHNLMNYFNNLILLKWNFYFPITGPSGPAFGINFFIIAFTMIISFLLINISVLSAITKRKYIISLILLFLGMNIAFNMFLIQESTLYLQGPDISEKSKEAISYAGDNYKDSVIYTNFISAPYYLGRYKEPLAMLSLEDNPDKLHLFNYNSGDEYALLMGNKFREKGGIVILSDYPMLEDNTLLLKEISNCNKVKEFDDKNINVATIYNCDNYQYY